MRTLTSELAGARSTSLSAGRKSLLVVACLGAGVLALSMRYVPGELTQIIWGLAVAALFLGLALFARQRPALRPYWELPFAFFALALFVTLDNTVPTFVATSILRAPPVPGNPVAGTVSASVIVQLVEVAIAVAIVVGVTKASGSSLNSVFLRVGRFGWAMGVGIAGFAAFYTLFALHPSSRFFPSHGGLTTGKVLALTPALLVIVLGNGFLEELVFRGLFLKKYEAIFGPTLAIVLQAAVFALAHIGVSYTPFALFFIVVIVFPLGLLCGYLMRSSNGILASTLFHAGVDIAIYLAFLSYVI